VLDSNFTAIHQHQPNAVDDVHLTVGEIFMVESTRYNCHVTVAQESKQVNSMYKIFVFFLTHKTSSPLVMNIWQLTRGLGPTKAKM
jgi:hypothetical protein